MSFQSPVTYNLIRNFFEQSSSLKYVFKTYIILEPSPSSPPAGRPGHGELVSARPAGVRGRRRVGGGTAVTLFSNGPEPHVPKDCLTVRVGGGPAEAVFSNGPEARVPRDCLRIVTHPSVGGTAGRVRGTGGP